jgi:hypothetical protein
LGPVDHHCCRVNDGLGAADPGACAVGSDDRVLRHFQQQRRAKPVGLT